MSEFELEASRHRQQAAKSDYKARIEKAQADKRREMGLSA